MGKKIEVKVKFNVTIKNVFNLGAGSDGKSYCVVWKRGSKSQNRGQSQKAEVSGGIATFGDIFTIVATMLQDEKTKKFDTKKLEFTLKEDAKKSLEVGRVVLELAEYASAGHHGPIVLAFGGDKKSSKKASAGGVGVPSIKLDIDAEWTHFNKKKITTKKDGKDGLNIDGVEYGLETEASDLSEEDATTLGDLSESEPEAESDMEEDDSGDEGLQEMSAPVKSPTPSESSGAIEVAVNKASSSELRKIQKANEKEDKAKDKLIAKLQKEVGKLKQELSGKAMKATGSQQEVKHLKKELSEAKKHAKGANSDESENLKAELEKAKKTIKHLQDEKEKNSDSSDEAHALNGTEELQKELDSTKQSLREKEAEIKEKNRLFLQLQEELEVLRKTADSSTKKSKGEAEKLKKELESLRKELESQQKLQEKADDKRTEKNSSASVDPSLLANITQLQEELDATKKKLKKGKKDLVEKEKRIEELERSNTSQDPSNVKETEELKKQLEQQKAEIRALNKENREAKGEIETLQQELESVKSKRGDGESSSRSGSELEALRNKLKTFEKEKEEDDLIETEIYCMTSAFKDGVQVSAKNLCGTLIKWGVLDDPPNERMLSKILNALKKGYKTAADDNPSLIKWLSFAINLHEQLEEEVGTSEDENSGDIPENGIHIFRGSEKAAGSEGDDDPLSIFFHNLEAIIFEIYSAFLKNSYAQIDDIIIPAILQPAGDRQRGPGARNTRGGKNKSNTVTKVGLTNILAQHLEMLHKYYIFETVIKQFFCQIFYYINARLFNSLLRTEEHCSCGSGFQIKLGLSQLEEWISKADTNDKKHLSQAARHYLLHITEAANVLVVDKDIFTDEEMIEKVFPTLTTPQIKYLLEHFQTDQYAPNPVARNVMATLDGLARQRKGQRMLEVDEAYLLSLPKN